MVPFLLSESAIVKGILSPYSSILIITNCPAFLLWAILGASITNFLTSGAINCAEIILYIVLKFLLYDYFLCFISINQLIYQKKRQKEIKILFDFRNFLKHVVEKISILKEKQALLPSLGILKKLH